MPVSKPQGILGAVALAAVFSAWAVTGDAQQDAAPPAGKPPMTAPAPGAQTSPEARPQTQRPRAVPPSETPAGHDLIGLSVFSSDGTKVGNVRAVNTGPGGTVLHVKTGGFLGFGGRVVAIPGGAFAKKGPDIRLNLSAEEVDNLPEVKEGR